MGAGRPPQPLPQQAFQSLRLKVKIRLTTIRRQICHRSWQVWSTTKRWCLSRSSMTTPELDTASGATSCCCANSLVLCGMHSPARSHDRHWIQQPSRPKRALLKCVGREITNVWKGGFTSLTGRRSDHHTSQDINNVIWITPMMLPAAHLTT